MLARSFLRRAKAILRQRIDVVCSVSRLRMPDGETLCKAVRQAPAGPPFRPGRGFFFCLIALPRHTAACHATPASLTLPSHDLPRLLTTPRLAKPQPALPANLAAPDRALPRLLTLPCLTAPRHASPESHTRTRPTTPANLAAPRPTLPRLRSLTQPRLTMPRLACEPSQTIPCRTKPRLAMPALSHNHLPSTCATPTAYRHW